MQTIGAVLFVIYMAAGYWATGQTIYYNKIVFHEFGQLFLQRLALGTFFGWALIPAALIVRWLRNK